MADKTKISWTTATWKCCSMCKEEKPLTAFGQDRTRPDGLTYVCRECRAKRRLALYVPKGPPGRRGFLAPARAGDKKQARRRINYLVEQGLIPRPEDLGCLNCADMMLGGKATRYEYHHFKGYASEHQLTVIPLCSRCHHDVEEAGGAY